MYGGRAMEREGKSLLLRQRNLPRSQAKQLWYCDRQYVVLVVAVLLVK